jgi:hypothetical protein
MPDAAKTAATLARATVLNRATPGRRGSVVRLQEADEVLVVGDLHGHLHTLARAVKQADLENHPRRHLVLQELVHDPRIDPDDGLDLSHRAVDLAAALKCRFPARVHILLGNHELSELTGRSIAKNQVALNALFRKGLAASFGADQVEAIRQAYCDFFRSLPLVLLTDNRIALCHTVPDARDLPGLDRELLDTGAWSEPAMARGGTVYALTWGRDTRPDTADAFAAFLDVDHFVTGHHPCDHGFERLGPRHLALDATDPEPGICLFSARAPLTFDALCAGVRILTS